MTLKEKIYDPDQKIIFSNAYNDFQSIFLNQNTDYQKLLEIEGAFEKLFILNKKEIYRDADIVFDASIFRCLDNLIKSLGKSFYYFKNGYYKTESYIPTITLNIIYDAYVSNYNDYLFRIQTFQTYPGEFEIGLERVVNEIIDSFLTRIALNLWVGKGRNVPKKYSYLIKDLNVLDNEKCKEENLKNVNEGNIFDFLEI